MILHFVPKMFSNYTVKEKALLRVTRNADIDTETIYVFVSEVPLDMSFVFALQNSTLLLLYNRLYFIMRQKAGYLFGRSYMNRPVPMLGNPQNTVAVLQKYGFNFQKKFGQNFLIDTHVLDKIVKAADVTEDDFVVEIGPGIGTLTQYLAYHAKEVCAVEIDQNLIPILEDTLQAYDNVTVLNEDILKVDLCKLAEEKNGGKPVKIVANLPYYITTPIIMGLFENHVPVKSVTVMVQKEVADRMQSDPGCKDYGALSLAVQYYAEPYIAANVPPNCFMPRPKVGSAVICLTLHEKPTVQVKDEKLMFQLIRASFNQRRKTLVNGITNFQGLSFSKEQVTNAVEACGFSATIRGEKLTLAEFAALADCLIEA